MRRYALCLRTGIESRCRRLVQSVTRCQARQVHSSLHRLAAAAFTPHAMLQQSPLPAKEAWLASLDGIAKCSPNDAWDLDLVSIRDAALVLGCRTASEEATLLQETASVLAHHVAPVETLSLHINDGTTVLAATQIATRALSNGNLTRLAITVQPPSFSSPSSATDGGDRRGAASDMRIKDLLVSLASLDHVPTLHSFELRITEASWDDEATLALARLIAKLRLTALTLNYVPVRNGPHPALTALAEALAGSVRTLERLDLKGMGPLLHHTSLLRPPSTPGGDRPVVSLGDCHRLRHLDVGHTQLGDVPMMNLLSALREAIGGWTQLVTLGLAQCEMTAYTVSLLRRDVPRLTETEAEAEAEVGAASWEAKVETLNLSSNALTDGVAFELASCLVPCRQLRLFDLRHNRFTRRGIGQLLSGLVHASELRTLRLRANRIQDDGFQQLVPLFRYWPALEELDLTRCQLTSRSLLALSTVLPQAEALRRVYLAGNDYHLTHTLPAAGGADTDTSEAKLFAYDPDYMRGGAGRGALKVPTSYELDRRDRETGRIRYRGPSLEDASDAAAAPEQGAAAAAAVDVLAAFGDALNSCRALEVLDLSDASISDDGFASFVSVGLALPALRTLTISANPLFQRVHALDQLVALLWCTPALEALDVSFTGLGDLGLSMLCDGAVTDGNADAEQVGVLTQLSHLRSLHVAHCGATGGLGVEALAGCLERMPALEVLVLNGNTLAQPIAPLSALLKAARSCPRLRHLSLHGCTAASKDRAALETSESRRVLVAAGVDVLV